MAVTIVNAGEEISENRCSLSHPWKRTRLPAFDRLLTDVYGSGDESEPETRLELELLDKECLQHVKNRHRVNLISYMAKESESDQLQFTPPKKKMI